MHLFGTGIVLISFLLILIPFGSCGHHNGRLWSWVCKNGVCVKDLKSQITPDLHSTTLAVCKLNCASHGVLWPIPTGKVEIGKELQGFVPSGVEFRPIQAQDAEVKSMLQNASEIFKSYLLQMHPDSKITGGKPVFHEDGPGAKITITLGSAWDDKVNGLSTDESYVLSVAPTDGDENGVQVNILGNTFFGVRHGLETLSQLIAYDEDSNMLKIVQSATISDKPVFPYRGVLIDTSRNFFSIESLQRLLDGMSYNKLNVLHWHITDTHSFPFQSLRVPQMSEYGAYSKRKIYTPDQIKDLIHYARIRGIKIVPEFDEPAHTGNGWQWGPSKGLGNLAVCVNQEPWQDFCVEPPCGQLNIVNENMYNVLGDIFKDLFDLFDRDIFHMGGDEINFACWNTTKEITDWMTANHYEITHDGFLHLWARFQAKAYEKVKEANGGKDVSSILWTSELTGKDVVEKHLSNGTYIIQVWTKGDDALIPFLVSKNYRLIMANYDAWYLDCGYAAWVGPGPSNWCPPYIGWQQMYSHNPLLILANKTSPEEASRALKDGLILGGVTSMWSEQVDEAALEGKVWPRAAAVAERLWSNPITSWVKAETRMVQNRQRLVERGLRADVVQPEWCLQNEGHCYL